MVRASIRTQFLIYLVCERPALWDKTCNEYKHRELKETAWREICSYINKDYNNLPPKEKEEFTKSIVKKWSHIRSLWLKSMKYGYDEVTMMPPKPYVYHDEMQFMQKILKWKPPRYDLKMYQLNKMRLDQLYSERNETQSSNGTTRIDKNEEVKNATDNEFSAVTLKQEPNADNHVSSEFTIVDMQEDFNEFEERKVSTPAKSAKVATSEYTRPHCQRSAGGHNLYENRHCNFFKAILPSVDGLDEDHVLQFQSGVISLLRNLRQFQKLKSYRSRKQKANLNDEDVSIHKPNSTKMLTRHSLNTSTMAREDLGSETEYLSDEKLNLS